MINNLNSEFVIRWAQMPWVLIIPQDLSRKLAYESLFEVIIAAIFRRPAPPHIPTLEIETSYV